MTDKNNISLPERNASKPAEQQGLFRKFEVRRVDGSDQPGGRHHGCRYYVLDLNHDQHAPAAMRAYATSCASTHPQLAADIVAEFGATPAAERAQGGLTEAVRKALEPFAKIADLYDEREDDSYKVWLDFDQKETRFTLGQCRAARAILASQPATMGSAAQGERAAVPSPLRQAVRAIQAVPCPYNEKDHGTNWHASAHAWDMAMIEAIRAVNRLIDAAPAPAPVAPNEIAEAHALLSKYCVGEIDKGQPVPLVRRIEELYSWYYAAVQPEDDDAPVAQEGEQCAWMLDDPDNGIWQSSCGEAWSFVDGGPVENRVSFCQGCGKPVRLQSNPAQQDSAQVAAKGGEA